MDKLLELIGVHGPVAGVFLAMGAVLGFHIKEDRSRTRQQDDRLRRLELTRASKSDVRRLHERIDGLSSQVAENQTELLGAISRQRG